MAKTEKGPTLEELLSVDLDELYRLAAEAYTKRKLRRERPWTRDIIRVLWGTRSMSFDRLTRQLWELRDPSGLPMPKRFEKTVQSCLNQHTSQSKVFARLGRPEDDIFYSPGGKFSGTWAVHRERVIAWLKRRGLPEA
jgi:hypothetical protein